MQGVSAHARVYDHAGSPGVRAGAPVRLAFRDLKRVGTRDRTSFAAQWLACALPCRRFDVTLAGAAARLGAGVARYAFLVVDSHHLLLAGLPALSDQVSANTADWRRYDDHNANAQPRLARSPSFDLHVTGNA